MTEFRQLGELRLFLAKLSTGDESWVDKADKSPISGEADGVLIKGEFTTFLKENGVNIVDKKTEDIINEFWRTFDTEVEGKVGQGTSLNNANALNTNELNNLNNKLEKDIIFLRFMNSNVETYLNAVDSSTNKTLRQELGKYLPDWKSAITEGLTEFVDRNETITIESLTGEFTRLATIYDAEYKTLAQVDLALNNIKTGYPYYNNWGELENLVKTAISEGKTAAEIQTIINNYVADINPTTNYDEIQKDYKDVYSGFTQIQQTEIIAHLKETLYTYLDQNAGADFDDNKKVYLEAIDQYIRNVLAGHGVGGFNSGEDYNDVFDRITELNGASIFNDFTKMGILAEVALDNIDENSVIYNTIVEDLGIEYADYFISNNANEDLLGFILAEIKLQMAATADNNLTNNLKCNNLETIAKAVVRILNDVLNGGDVSKIIVEDGKAKLNSAKNEFETTSSDSVSLSSEELAFFKNGLPANWSNEALDEFVTDAVNIDYNNEIISKEVLADIFSSYISILNSRGEKCNDILKECINDIIETISDEKEIELLKSLLNNGYKETLLFNNNMSKDTISKIINKFIDKLNNNSSTGSTNGESTVGGDSSADNTTSTDNGNTQPKFIDDDISYGDTIYNAWDKNSNRWTDDIGNEADLITNSSAIDMKGEVKDDLKSFITDSIVDTLKSKTNTDSSAKYNAETLDKIGDLTYRYFAAWIDAVKDGLSKDKDQQKGTAVSTKFTYTLPDGTSKTETQNTIQICRGTISQMFDDIEESSQNKPIYLLEDNTGKNQFCITFNKEQVLNKFKEFYLLYA